MIITKSLMRPNKTEQLNVNMITDVWNHYEGFPGRLVRSSVLAHLICVKISEKDPHRLVIFTCYGYVSPDDRTREIQKGILYSDTACWGSNAGSALNHEPFSQSHGWLSGLLCLKSASFLPRGLGLAPCRAQRTQLSQNPYYL